MSKSSYRHVAFRIMLQCDCNVPPAAVLQPVSISPSSTIGIAYPPLTCSALHYRSTHGASQVAMQRDGSARWGTLGLDHQVDFDEESYDNDAKFAGLDDDEDDLEDAENDVPQVDGDDRTRPAQHQAWQSEAPTLTDETAGQRAVGRAVSSSPQLFPSLSPGDRLLIDGACRTPSAAGTVHSSDRIMPNTKHPRRPRALSYDAGLAELTVRLKRYSQGNDEYDLDGADNDASGTSLALGEAFGESASSASGGGFGLGLGRGSDPPFASGGPGGLASGVGGASPSTGEEDRSKAQTAMERIRSKRAGTIAAAANNTCRPGRDSSASAPNIQEQQQKYRPEQKSSGRRQRRRRRRRSASEPPPLVRTSIGFKAKAEANTTCKTENCNTAQLKQERRSSAQSTSSLNFDELQTGGSVTAKTKTETIISGRPQPRPRGHVVSQSMAVPAKGSISDLMSSLPTVGEGEAAGVVGLAGGGGNSSGSNIQNQQAELESRALMQNFVMEHRIFLRAILQLLNERDQFAVEADANDPHTIKTGPLKKATSLVRGVWKWKVKYVEVRRGLFSYYEDTTDSTGSSGKRRGSTATAEDNDDDIDGAVAACTFDSGDVGNATAANAETANLRRKSIPLRAATCTCRAVKVQNKALSHTPLSSNGAVFELTVEGGPRRLWMCNTREERQAWIHAIHEAMIGGSVTRGDNFLEYQVERKRGGGGSSSIMAGVPMRSPYRSDLERYLRLQNELKNARSQEAYVGALAELYDSAESLNVPVQWIKERIEVASSSNAPNQGGFQAFHEGGLSSGVAQLWKDMLRDSVSINGDLYKGDGGHGPERIIGALARCIMSFDKSATQNVNATRAYRKKFCITESQAVSYARDVLLACNRTRSGGDSYYCMDTLCSNHELVVLCPSSSEADPLRITVRHSANDGISRRGSNVHGFHDISGWILTRSGPNKSWKKRFGVLSEGVLSYYEQAHPRPHGLRGQVLLAGATIGVSQVGNTSEESDIDELSPSKPSSQADAFARIPTRKTKYIVCIITKDRSKERQIIFDDQNDFFLWNQSFRDAIKVSEVSARGNRGDNGNAGKVSASTMIANKFRGLSTRAKEGVISSSPNRNFGMGRFGRGVGGNGGGDAAAAAAADEFAAAISADNGENDFDGDGPSASQTNHARSRSANWKKVKGGRARSTVEVSVQNTAVYKICTVDPQGDDSQDTWAMLRTNFLQNFRLSGGPNGRILRGEEVVQLNFLKGLVATDTFDKVYDASDDGTDEAGNILRRASVENLNGEGEDDD